MSTYFLTTLTASISAMVVLAYGATVVQLGDQSERGFRSGPRIAVAAPAAPDFMTILRSGPAPAPREAAPRKRLADLDKRSFSSVGATATAFALTRNNVKTR